MRKKLLSVCCLLVMYGFPGSGSNTNYYDFSARPTLAIKDTTRNIRHLKQPLYGFYEKVLYSDSIPIRASKNVYDKALLAASTRMMIMLVNMPNVKHNLIQYGAELHIIPRSMETSDIPEFRDKKGTTITDRGKTYDFDVRTRGRSDIFSFCAEENLLGLLDDRWVGYDVSTHEIAHAIMTCGLNDQMRSTIAIQYQKSLAKGLWKNTYAATNANEYWAELSTWYFGGHGEFLNTRKIDYGPDGLEAYDKDAYDLLNSIYTGELQPPAVNLVPMTKTSNNENVSYNKSDKASRIFVFNDTPHTITLLNANTPNQSPFGTRVFPFGHTTFYSLYSQHYIIQDETGKQYKYLNAGAPLCKLRISTITE